MLKYCGKSENRLISVVHYYDQIDNYIISEAVFSRFDLMLKKSDDGTTTGPFMMDTKEHKTIRFDVIKGTTEVPFPSDIGTLIMVELQKGVKNHASTILCYGKDIPVEYKVSDRNRLLPGQSIPLF